MNLSEFIKKIGITMGLIYPLTYCVFQAITRGYVKVTLLYVFSILLIFFSVIIRKKQKVYLVKESISIYLFYMIIVVDMAIRGSETQAIFLEYLFLYISCIFLSNDIKWYKYLSKLLLGIGVFYAFTVVFQAIWPENFNNVVRPLFPIEYQSKLNSLNALGYTSGLTSQPAIVSCYLIIGTSALVSILYSNHISKKKNWKGYYVMLVILSIAVLLTGKRAAPVFIMLAFLLMYYFCAENVGKKFIFIFSLTILVSFAYIFVVPIIIELDIFPSLTRIFTMLDAEGLGNGRNYYWNLGIEIINENLFYGVGWENYIKYSGASYNCHNIYIQLLAEEGIVIGSLLIFLILINWNNNRKLLVATVKNRMVNQKIFMMLVFSFLVQTYFIAYGFTGNPLYDSEYIAFYGVALLVFLSAKKNLVYSKEC